jgi:hypothetical protein
MSVKSDESERKKTYQVKLLVNSKVKYITISGYTKPENKKLWKEIFEKIVENNSSCLLTETLTIKIVRISELALS